MYWSQGNDETHDEQKALFSDMWDDVSEHGLGNKQQNFVVDVYREAVFNTSQ